MEPVKDGEKETSGVIISDGLEEASSGSTGESEDSLSDSDDD